MTRFNALAEQMGVGQLDDDDRHDLYEVETPEPCRGCNRTDCGEQCAEYAAYIAGRWLAVDRADRASQAAYTSRWGAKAAARAAAEGGGADA